MILLYDTTLRDGTQAEDISFSVEDKVRVARSLDELGVHYIEGGWPGSNPRDIEFFKAVAAEKLSRATLVSFGSTRKAGVKAKDDANLKALLSSRTPVITIFGKTWKLHVTKALRVSLEENLEMIFDSVSYLKKKVDKVFYDAEHFFDGYKDDPDYALETLEGGRGRRGRLPRALRHQRRDVAVRGRRDNEGGKAQDLVRRSGIHAHNDSETAVANSLCAVREGAMMVQGTINGFGERCGNANLCSIIPALKVKMGLDCLSGEQLKKLRSTARFVNEIANLPHAKHQPYVGDSAFAHKGGIHVSAILKNPATYEHMMPELVGNHQRVLVSDLSGRSNILYKAEEYGVDIKSGSDVVRDVLAELKSLEHQGFQYEGAEASFELLIQKALKKKQRYFKLLDFRVIDEKRSEDEAPHAEATIKLEVGGVVEHTAAEGSGPVNALDKALRKALERFYPAIKDVQLLDFKVRVLEGMQGTAAKVRVLVESGDSTDKWGTVGVSDNVIEASWQALVDSLEYKLSKDQRKKKRRK